MQTSVVKRCACQYKSRFLRREDLFDTDRISPCSIGLNLACLLSGEQVMTHEGELILRAM